jgi:hypothetical protein
MARPLPANAFLDKKRRQNVGRTARVFFDQAMHLFDYQIIVYRMK